MKPGEGAEEQDAADMRELATGRDAALDSLMDRHAPSLMRYLVRQLQSQDDAADLAQETFVRVYQNRHKFNPRYKFSTWMYTIATNLVRDRFRWRSRHPESSLDRSEDRNGPSRDVVTSEATPSQELQQEERAEAVRQAVADLPEDLRTPLILSEYEEKSHAEIGAILRCSAKAVEMRLYRARARLRESLSALVGIAES